MVSPSESVFYFEGTCHSYGSNVQCGFSFGASSKNDEGIQTFWLHHGDHLGGSRETTTLADCRDLRGHRYVGLHSCPAKRGVFGHPKGYTAVQQIQWIAIS